MLALSIVTDSFTEALQIEFLSPLVLTRGKKDWCSWKWFFSSQPFQVDLQPCLPVKSLSNFTHYIITFPLPGNVLMNLLLWTTPWPSQTSSSLGSNELRTRTATNVKQKCILCGSIRRDFFDTASSNMQTDKSCPYYSLFSLYNKTIVCSIWNADVGWNCLQNSCTVCAILFTF